MSVIYAAIDGGRSALARGLALRPVQWLGDASYSAYLWHWPIVVAAPYLVADSLAASDSMLALTLLLAGFSKRFVDDPFLHPAQWSARPPRFWYRFAATGMVVIVGTAMLVRQSSVSEPRPIELEQTANTKVTSCRTAQRRRE